MSRRSVRQKVRAWQEEQRWRAALTTPRHYRDHIDLRGIGSLIVRIALLPSFQETTCWDFRTDPKSGATRIYVARSTEAGDPVVVGYSSVQIDSAVIDDVVGLLRAGCAAAGPPEDVDFLIADGVWFDVAFHSPIASASFRWCEDRAPATWSSLEQATKNASAMVKDAPEEAVQPADGD